MSLKASYTQDYYPKHGINVTALKNQFLETPRKSSDLFKTIPSQKAIDLFRKKINYAAFKECGYASNSRNSSVHPNSSGMNAVYHQIWKCSSYCKKSSVSKHQQVKTGRNIFWNLDSSHLSERLKIKAIENTLLSEAKNQLQRLSKQLAFSDSKRLNQKFLDFFQICNRWKVLNKIPLHFYRKIWLLAGAPDLIKTDVAHSKIKGVLKVPEQIGRYIFQNRIDKPNMNKMLIKALHSSSQICRLPTAEQDRDRQLSKLHSSNSLKLDSLNLEGSFSIQDSIGSSEADRYSAFIDRLKLQITKFSVLQSINNIFSTINYGLDGLFLAKLFLVGIHSGPILLFYVGLHQIILSYAISSAIEGIQSSLYLSPHIESKFVEPSLLYTIGCFMLMILRISSLLQYTRLEKVHFSSLSNDFTAAPNSSIDTSISLTSNIELPNSTPTVPLVSTEPPVAALIKAEIPIESSPLPTVTIHAKRSHLKNSAAAKFLFSKLLPFKFVF